MSIGEAAHGRNRARVRAALRPVLDLARKALAAEGEHGPTQRAALFAFLVRVVSAGIAYFSQALLARWMGSFEYGIFVFVWVWVLILGGFAPLGLSTSTTRFVPEYRETARSGLLRGLLLASRVFAVAVSTLFALAGMAALYWFGHLLESYYLLPAFLILFCLPFYTLMDLQDGIARGFAWMDLALVPPYILRPLLLLGAMLGVYLLGYPMTAVSAAAAAVFACWAAGLMQLAFLRKRVSRHVEAGPRSYEAGLWLRTSVPLLLVHGFELLLQNTDILVLSRYMSPSDVAVYFAALKTIGLVAFVHFAVGAAAANRFSAYNTRGERDKLQQAVGEAVRWTFWPSLAGAVGLLILGKPLLWLFGPEFTAGYPLMFILALGLVVRAAMGPVELILNMLGQQKRCAGVLFVSAMLNLALNFALIPVFGLYGAAWATAVSLAAAALLMGGVAHRQLGLNLLVWGRKWRAG